MLSALKKVIGLHDAGATIGELEDLHYHNSFSNYFPWFAYDTDNDVYHNTDDTLGFIWECTPLVFSSDKTLQLSSGLLRLPLPPKSVLQFILHADGNIKPFLESYRALRANSSDPLVHDAVESYCSFLEKCTEGIRQLSGIPLRNFRLIVSLKFDAKTELEPSEIKSLVTETLSGMHLAPRLIRPPALLEWLRRLLNDNVPEVKQKDGSELASLYNDNVAIGKQVLFSDTPIDASFTHMKVGEKYWRCMSPKGYPQEVDPLQTKELFGGIWGIRSDNEQHRVPFLYAINIIYDNLKNHLRTKCDLILQQSAVGSWARSLYRKQDEHNWAIDKIDQGEVFARVMPMMWFIGRSYAEADDALKRGKRIWEGAGYLMQEDKGILPAMFLSSLPMGMRATKNNLNMLERDTITSADAICNILPIQGDFSGSNEPVMILQGRTGQISPVSIFSKLALNFNGFIAASSGGGKSFTVNMLGFCHYTAGTILRIVDIGGSYKRLCHILEGKYLDIGPDIDICFNPFSNITDPEEDLASIVNIVMQMVYSSSETAEVAEDEWTLAKDAVEWAYKQRGKNTTIDDVYDYLQQYPDFCDHPTTDVIVQYAKHMAFNMREFTSYGKYGRYFIGDSTMDIANDRFLLLELGKLSQQPSLFKVVTLLVLDAVTRDLYLSDRTQRRLVIFDEAWQFLSGASGNVMMRNIIEGGFRKARKHGGGFWVITQSLLDRQLFGPIGDIIWNNADYKILLESKDFEKALSEKLINYDPFTIELLNSVQRNKTNYSEIYLDTPYGAGVARLAVDSFNYYLFTTNSDEVAEMDEMYNSGMTYREAINAMVKKYRSDSLA